MTRSGALTTAALVAAIATDAGAVSWRVMPAELPAPVRAAVLREAGRPLAELKLRKRPTTDGKGEYTATFGAGGKDVEIKIGADGALLRRRERHRQEIAALPPAVSAAARSALGAHQPRRAVKNVQAGAVSYDVTAENADEDTLMTVSIAADGRVVRTSEPLKGEAVPKPILAAIKRAAGKARLWSVYRVTHDGRIGYDVECDTREVDIELGLGADGTVLRRSEFRKELPAALE